MISLHHIEQPSRDIGRKAVDLLLNKIDNPDAPTKGDDGRWRCFPRQHLINNDDANEERISFPIGDGECTRPNSSTTAKIWSKMSA